MDCLTYKLLSDSLDWIKEPISSKLVDKRIHGISLAIGSPKEPLPECSVIIYIGYVAFEDMLNGSWSMQYPLKYFRYNILEIPLNLITKGDSFLRLIISGNETGNYCSVSYTIFYDDKNAQILNR